MVIDEDLEIGVQEIVIHTMDIPSTDENAYGSESSTGTVTSKPPSYEKSQESSKNKKKPKTFSASNLRRRSNSESDGSDRRLSLANLPSSSQTAGPSSSQACVSSANFNQKKSSSHIIVTPIYKNNFNPCNYYIYFHKYIK